MRITIGPFPSAFVPRSFTVDGASVVLVGRFHVSDADAPRAMAALLDRGVLMTGTVLRDRIATLHGNFAFILTDRTGTVLACADRIRSYPISYAAPRDTLIVGGDAAWVRERAGTHEPDRDALLEFAMAGYVTGGDTLYRGLRQLGGGEFLCADRTAWRVDRYYAFSAPTRTDRSPAEWCDALDVVHEQIFRTLITRLDGRPAVVPLSGGLDSRLVITQLKRFGYDDIRAFSYGVPGNCEARAASQIAERLHVPWVFVPYTRALGRAQFHTASREAYFALAHAYTTIPMVTDFYALRVLQESRWMPERAVLLNGQTGDFISGGHIPKALDQHVVSKQLFLDAVLAKHYMLWAHLRTDANCERMRERIVRTMGEQIPDTMDRETAKCFHERWEWAARQCVHVVPGQRMYEANGLAWELPLWDDAYLAFWSEVPFSEKFQQTLYRRYLERNDFFGCFRTMRFPRYTPPKWAALASVALAVTGAQSDAYRKQFLAYWQKYAYFYALYPYRSYMRFAPDHRNPSSLLAAMFLESMDPAIIGDRVPSLGVPMRSAYR